MNEEPEKHLETAQDQIRVKLGRIGEALSTAGAESCCLQQMPERRICRTLRLPAVPGSPSSRAARRSRHRSCTGRPAPALLQDPRDVLAREQARRARDQGTRLDLRQRSQDGRIPEDVEEGRAVSAVVRQLNGRGVGCQDEGQVTAGGTRQRTQPFPESIIQLR